MKNFKCFLIFCSALLFLACNETQSSQKEEENIDATEPAVELIGAHEVSTEVSDFVGIWNGPDNYPLVEITHKEGKFHVRECYGLDAKKGTYYTGILKDGVITAEGNEDDFYKGTLPTFELMENGQLNQNSGVGPIDLNKSKQTTMPNVEFAAPMNND